MFKTDLCLALFSSMLVLGCSQSTPISTAADQVPSNQNGPLEIAPEVQTEIVENTKSALEILLDEVGDQCETDLNNENNIDLKKRTYFKDHTVHFIDKRDVRCQSQSWPDTECCALSDCTIAQFIRDGKNLSSTNTDDETMLMCANTARGVKMLIAAGVDVNQGKHSNALFYHSDIESIKALVEAGADVNRRDSKHNTPLSKAKSTEIMKYLVSSGADPYVYVAEKSMLSYTLDAEGMRYFLNLGFDPNKLNTPTLNPIPYAKDTESLQMLFDAGWEIDSPEIGFKALSKASSVSFIQLLLEHGVDLYQTNNAGNTAIMIATDPKVIKAFIDVGYDVNWKSPDSHLTALHRIASTGCLECVKLLVEAGADVNAKTTDGWPPITYTHKNEIGKYLVDHGAITKGLLSKFKKAHKNCNIKHVGIPCVHWDCTNPDANLERLEL